MKIFIVSAVLCVIVPASFAGQMTKYGVTVTAEKNVDFARFKTYSWTQGQPSADKTIDAQITAAVERELSALGMTKAPSGPGDVLVTYSSVSRTDVDVTAKRKPNELPPQYSVGTLVVALLDPGNRRRLLRLRVDKPIETGPEQLKAAIDGAIAELFARYPTRSRK
jgi:Domain of unknown function (DUF4136)